MSVSTRDGHALQTPGLRPVPLTANGGFELFRLHFGPAATAPAGAVATGLDPLGAESAESWLTAQPAQHWRRGEVHCSEADGFLFCHVSRRVDGDVQRLARQVYLELGGSLAERTGYRLARAWNFVPDINQGGGDDERYRRFCAGRSAALEELGIAEDDLPAATAVGVAPGCDLVVALLATTRPVRPVENPRQVPAFRYPRDYGPRSPSFARATWLDEFGSRRLLIAGTASIVGHRTMHSASITEQARETMDNLAALADAAGLGAEAARIQAMKVYVRRADDLDAVRSAIGRNRPFGAAPAAFLRADICRRELLVEMELVLQP